MKPILTLLIYTLVTASSFAQPTIADLMKSVVLVRTEGISAKRGTGFFLSRDRIGTCLHVVAGCNTAVVEYESRNGSDTKDQQKGNVIYRNRKSDFAILKLDKPFTGARIVTLSSGARAGDELTLIGYPLDRRFMIDSKCRIRGTDKKTIKMVLPSRIVDSWGNYPLLSLDTRILDIEGSLSPGHSGAPLFDAGGKVAGMADGGIPGETSVYSWAIAASEIADAMSSPSDDDLSFFQALTMNFLMVNEFADPNSTIETLNIGDIKLGRLRVSTVGLLKDYLSIDQANPVQKYLSTFTLKDYSNLQIDIYGDAQNSIYFAMPKATTSQFNEYQVPYTQNSELYGIRAEFFDAEIIFDLTVRKCPSFDPNSIAQDEGLFMRRAVMNPTQMQRIAGRTTEDGRGKERISIDTGYSFQLPFEKVLVSLYRNGLLAELNLVDKNAIKTSASIARQKAWANLVTCSMLLHLE